LSDKSQRTEKPTAQRMRKARRDGQVPRTQELGAWLSVLAFTVVVPHLVRGLADRFGRTMADLQKVVVHPETAVAMQVGRDAATGALAVLAPLLATMVVVAVVANAAQGGIRVYPGRFKARFETLNPAKGLKNLVGAHAAWTFAKTLIKLGVFGWVGYRAVLGITDRVTGAGQWSLGASAAAGTEAALSVLRTVAVVGIVLAAADYVMERRRVGTSLKMSREDVKRENRMSEGDPLLKGLLRGKQRELSRNRMLADLGAADVVMVNPTHVAVALAYEPGRGAPRVVAKGAGLVAARIRQEAADKRLPLVEDVPLTRMLYRSCGLGQEIPAELYDAVAGVFVFLMGLRHRGLTSGFHRNPGAHGTRELVDPGRHSSGPRRARR
jgi:flagellar biosynthetic protein FlhB